MNGVLFPQGFRLEPLQKNHPRRQFDCGQEAVTEWLRTKALQHQEKRLSATKVLLDGRGARAGFYTLATGLVDFADMPSDVAVILDCVDERARSFCQRWDFAELPGHPFRLFLNAQTLTAMMTQP